MAASKSDRTERPTPKKQQEAHRKGQIPRSMEVSGALTLLGAIGFFHFVGASWFGEVAGLTRSFLSLSIVDAGNIGQMELVGVVRGLGLIAPSLVLPPILTLGACSLGGQLVQARPVFTFEPVKPQLNKLNPIKGLQKLVKPKAFIQLAKAAFKVALVIAVGYDLFSDLLAGAIVPGRTPIGFLGTIGEIARDLFGRVALLFLGLAGIDVLVTRWDHLNNLKMSKQEIKDERKQSEGDPKIKSRQRAKQIEASRNRMIADVATANVVITNPTHYAVALQYDHDGAGVPRVVAKGVDHLARRIREAADEHGVPIHRDPPLARSLYRLVDVGEFIPESLFLAVAEVLALVFRPAGARR